MKTTLLLALLALSSCATTGWDSARLGVSIMEPKTEWGPTIFRPIDEEDLHRKNIILITGNRGYDLWDRLLKNWNYNN